jgi:orotate phosphoribosyltransferase
MARSNQASMKDEVVRLLPVRRGHFLLESGHHGDLWLDLELLCLRPEPVRRLAGELAARLARYQVEAVCGPLVEGAFVGLMVAAALGISFTYSERFAGDQTEGLYPVRYLVPGALRRELRGKRVAIVNDVINAGSAVRGTFADLQRCEAEPVVIGSLALLGAWSARFAADQKLGLEALASLPNEVWTPAECPLCAAGVPVMNAPGC